MSEELKYVKEYITKMNTQDNRATATPYYFQIRDWEYVASYHEGEGDRVSIVYDCDSYSGECLDKALDEMIECGVIEEKPKYDCQSELESYLTGKLDYFNGIFWEKKNEALKGVFFTETDADNHLKANAHHYSPDADTYVSHAWRAPELERFFQCVGELCGVEWNGK